MNLSSGGHEPVEITDAELRALADERAPILQQLSEGVIIAGSDGRLLFVNEAAQRLHGVRKLDVAPDEYSEAYSLFTMDGEPYPFEELPLARAVARGDVSEDARWRIRRPDGSEVVAIGSARPLMEGGHQIGAILTVHDDSERFDAERRLRASEERLRKIFEHSNDAIFLLDPERDEIREANPKACAMFGYTVDEIRVTPISQFHPKDLPAFHAFIQEVTDEGHGWTDEFACRSKDGRFIASEISASTITVDDRPCLLAIIRDITARKAADAALRESEERLRLVQAAGGIGSFDYDLQKDTAICSPEYYRLVGLPEGHPINRETWRQVIHPDDQHKALAALDLSVSERKPFDYEYRIIRPDNGEIRWLTGRATVIFDRDGQPWRYVGGNIDVTDRRAAEEAFRRKSEEFYALADNIPTLAWMAYADGSIFWYNRRWYEYTGTSPETQEGWGWESVHDPAVLPDVVERWTRALESGTGFEMTFPLRGADGSFRPFLTRAVPIRDEDGRLIRWFGSNTDVTAQREAEAALTSLNETLEVRVREEIERRTEAEEQLRQAQKMEAIGQLTGGIAHDFNNLLQIIGGNLDILARGLPEDSPRLRRSVDNAIKGTDRAAVLTQRLLAFSRRQPLAPKVIDPNKLVTGMSDMLHRTLGETYAIETVTGSGMWRVEADPNQLESALLNLAINARDAMPKGGKLTIETANTHFDHSYAERHSGVAAGQYAMICVSDTGSGMDPATAERAVEPFFTTKDVGKGTGLGLSMVYGFVKQSGGHLKIYSEPGEGTSVKIYLPRHQGPESDAGDGAGENAPEGVKGETILVCEDDEDVRAYSAEVLRELGYRVIEAADGESALRLLEAEAGRVNLLFTDIVLPGGLTGAMVAERARAMQAGLKVLFTTGYARNAIVHQGRLDPGVELLSKPFSYADLAARVRDVLDQD